jgi:hypothetical protein
MRRTALVHLAGIAGCLVVWNSTTHAVVPPPTLRVRLTSPVSTSRSRPGDPVSAISVTRLIIDGRVVATPGCVLPGVVVQSERQNRFHAPASVALAFTRLLDRNQVAYPLETRVIDVVNARETVDDHGLILGVSPRLWSRAFGRFLRPINYKPGAELMLSVTDAHEASAIVCDTPTPELEPTAELSRMVRAEPLRTFSRAKIPSDLTNLVFVGSPEALQAGFKAAGWVKAQSLSPASDVRTMVSAIARLGYAEAPVSPQFINGRPPDFVFQKQLNTSAKRDHVRIWRRRETFEGQPMWVGAATHDTGYVHTWNVTVMTHGIDPDVDDERFKIVNDLAFAGAVESQMLVDRPNAPHQSRTATGQPIRTDGRAAVVVLKPMPVPRPTGADKSHN